MPVKIQKQRKSQLESHISPLDRQLDEVLGYIKSCLVPHGIISKRMGRIYAALVKGVYKIPAEIDSKNLQGPIMIDIKEKCIYFSSQILEFSNEAIVGLLMHEIGHLTISPKNVESISRIHDKINPRSQVDRQVFQFVSNLSTDYEVESLQFTNFPNLKYYKEVMFFESKILRNKLLQVQKEKQVKNDDKREKVEGIDLINTLIDIFLYNHDVLNGSTIGTENAFTIFAKHGHEVMLLLDKIHNVLDSAYEIDRKIELIYGMLQPPKPEESDFLENLKKYLQIAKAFPFLRKKIDDLLKNEIAIQKIPGLEKIKNKIEETREKRDNVSKYQLNRTDSSSSADKEKSKIKEILLNFEDWEGLLEFDDDMLENFIDVLFNIGVDYIEGPTPDNPFEVDDKLKEAANENFQTEKDRKIEKTLENAEILLEDAMKRTPTYTQKEKIGVEPSLEFHELFQNFGLEGIFSMKSNFKLPFSKDLIQIPPSINEIFLVLFDVSGSMDEEQMTSCKMICTALIKQAAESHLKIGVIPFTQHCEEIPDENGEIFWNSNFYGLLEKIIDINSHGGTDFDKILPRAAEIIADYHQNGQKTIRMLFLTDGDDSIKDETYEKLERIKGNKLKTLVVYIPDRRDKNPDVLKTLTKKIDGKYLKAHLNADGRLKILSEFLLV